MVCASRAIGTKIAGGFVLVNVAALMAAWRACRIRPLGIGDFRAYLAAHEMRARRCEIHQHRDRSPTFGHAELAGLLGVSEKTARASINRLLAAGLLGWSGSAIDFPERPGPARGPEDSIGRGQGSVALPRRMLRHLAAGARPTLIATALGVLLRCLSRRKAGFDGRGRVKASWIARAFDVDLRRVKQARKDLVALGWIAPEPSAQRAENRWGRAYRIDLAWTRPLSGGRRLPPPPALQRPAIATPSVDPEPLPGLKNQEPAPGGPAGASLRGSGTQAPASPPAPAAVPIMPPTLAAPKLADVRPGDLEDTGRLLELHRQAVARGSVTASEADRLRFVAAAEHARAIAQSPAALFAWIVLEGCWRYLTQADEDRAGRRLRAHLHGRPAPARAAGPSLRSSLASMPGPGPSEDARVVRAIREASIRAGFFRDPWPAFASLYPEWSRMRWDAALGELGLG